MKYPENFTIEIYLPNRRRTDRIWIGCFDEFHKIFFGMMYYFDNIIYVNVNPKKYYNNIKGQLDFFDATEKYIEQFEYWEIYDLTKRVINNFENKIIDSKYSKYWHSPICVKDLEN